MNYLQQKENRVIFLSALIALLKSRRVLLLVVNAVVIGLVTAFPELEPLKEIVLNDTFQIGVLVLIAGLSVEDAVGVYNTTKGTLPDTMQDSIRGIVDEALTGLNNDDWQG